MPRRKARHSLVMELFMKILSFGEIIWDIFGDEHVIGGAPFNFAAHAARLGAESYMVSAVGKDDNGRNALEECKRLSIRTDHIFVDRDHPTGVCNVTLDNGKPKYDLALATAYDHIPQTLPRGNFDALYMGTLAMRSAESRRSFDMLIKYLPRKEVFFDINLRGGFYSRELINTLLKETTVLKISDEEIGFFGKSDEISVCLNIAKSNPKLKYICLTKGAQGAAVFDCIQKTVLYSDIPKNKPLSTVGAGDSFSAAFLVSLLEGREITECLDRAVKLSDFVVTQLGAVPDYDPDEVLGAK